MENNLSLICIVVRSFYHASSVLLEGLIKLVNGVMSSLVDRGKIDVKFRPLNPSIGPSSKLFIFFKQPTQIY